MRERDRKREVDVRMIFIVTAKRLVTAERTLPFSLMARTLHKRRM